MYIMWSVKYIKIYIYNLSTCFVIYTYILPNWKTFTNPSIFYIDKKKLIERANNIFFVNNYRRVHFE